MLLEDKKTWRFTHNGVRFQMCFRRHSGQDHKKKTRVFAWLPEDDDDTVLDNISKRDRGGSPDDEVKRRRKAMRLLAQVGIAKACAKFDIEEPKLRYSIHAGCSMCPCSPGFIADVDFGGDLFISTVASIEKGKKEALQSKVRSAKRKVKEAQKGLKQAKRKLEQAEARLRKAS